MRKNLKGFALPTILIASVVMMTVLLVTVSSTASIRASLLSAQYDKLAQSAGEAGTTYAKACLEVNSYQITWSNSKPLRPNTDCNGDVVGGLPEYILEQDNVRTSFTVNQPSLDSQGRPTVLSGIGKVEIVRSSNNQVWRTYEHTTIDNTVEPYIDDGFPIASSIDGYWETPPAGYLFEDGSAVSRIQYASLFAVIGTTFGTGDGSTTFNLPDSRGRVAVNKSSDAEFDTLGEKVGTKTHTLTGPQSGIAAHNHPFSGSTQSFGMNYGANAGAAATFRLAVVAVNTTTYQGPYSPQPAGPTNAAEAHPIIQPSIVKNSAIKYAVGDLATSNLPAGTSISGYWNNAPDGYLVEDGSAVSRSAYSALFSVVGTQHGTGDGSTTFNLPDSRGRVAVNKSSDAEFDTLGEKVGTKTHTLTGPQSGIAAHNHPFSGSTQSFGVDWAPNAGAAATFRVAVAAVNTTTYQGPYSPQPAGPTNAAEAHPIIQPSIVKLSVIKHTPVATDEPTTRTGTSVKGYWTTPPAGYLFEDGSAVSRIQYASLFAVIGTTFGTGDGSTTFNLPDSRGRVAVNKSSDAEFDTLGEKVGTKTHTLTGPQSGIAAHNHPFSGSTQSFGMNWGANAGAAATFRVAVAAVNTTTYQGPYSPQPAGPTNAAEAHPIIQPSIVKNFAIKY